VKKCWEKICGRYYTGKVQFDEDIDSQVADAGVRRTDLEAFLKNCHFCKGFSRYTNQVPVRAIVHEKIMGRLQIDLKDYSNKPHDGNQ
jgi:hypothetical protein